MTIHKGPEPSDRQEQFLRVAFDLAAKLGRPPTSGEIAAEMGTTRRAALRQLTELEAMGVIADVPMQIRSGRWRLTAAGRAKLEPRKPA